MVNRQQFVIANAVNAIFIAGYIILKFPLAYILSHYGGYSLSRAYSLTTTATIAFAFCSLLFSVSFKEYHNQKHAILIGILLNLVAVLLLARHQVLLGLAIYVVGASLYFFNFTLFINKQFSTCPARLQGNYITQICLNMGAVLGVVLFIFGLSHGTHFFKYSIGLLAISFILLLAQYFLLEDQASSVKQNVNFYILCLSLVSIVVFLLNHAGVTRELVLSLFFIFIVMAIYQSQKFHEKGYFLFIMLILTVSLPFWICNTIVYNQFYVFLHQNIPSVAGLPSAVIILLDPLANIVFGFFWTWYIKDKTIHISSNIIFSLFLIFIGFVILSILLYVQTINTTFIIYPAITIILFSCAQFAIQPAMHSLLRDIIHNDQHMIFALGILRSIRALAAVLAFYWMNMTATSTRLLFSMPRIDLFFFGVSAMLLIAITSVLILRKHLLMHIPHIIKGLE